MEDVPPKRAERGGDAVDVTPERLAHQRVGASAYFSKLHRKLAQIFSAVLYCCVNVAAPSSGYSRVLAQS
jgi:hypothetical protein